VAWLDPVGALSGHHDKDDSGDLSRALWKPCGQASKWIVKRAVKLADKLILKVLMKMMWKAAKEVVDLL